MTAKALAPLFALVLGACVTQHSVPFSDAEFARYAAGGPAILQGSALGRTAGGDIKTCGALPVYLAPATPYTREAVGHLYTLDAATLAAGPSKRYWQETACDAQGKFEFRNVAPGPWFVLTSIEYERLSAPRTAADMRGLGAGIAPTEREGGLVMKEVNLRPGANSVILTQNDLHTSPLSGL